MAITEREARELADLLPEGMSYTDARSRLLVLVEMLHALTDADHCLANADIRAVFRAYFGDDRCPAENTINSDLRVLRENGIAGLRVHTTPSGSWCENAQLPPGKVRLLLNAVQASRFLTTEQSYELQEDLANLVSRYQEDLLFGEVFVDQRTRTGYQQVFETNDTISRAIREGRKIEFEYAFNNYEGKPVMLPGDNGNTLRIETPIGLVFSDNNYYLDSYSAIPWRHGTRVIRSRVDRMYHVRVSEQPADVGDEVEAARASLRRRVIESVEMVDGTSRTLFLRVRGDCTNIMFDRFGFGLRFGQFSGRRNGPEGTGITCVTVAESFTFFRWLSAAGDGIVMVEPPNEMWVLSGPWPESAKRMPLAALREDYRVMRAGYLAFLDRARSAYDETGSASK